MSRLQSVAPAAKGQLCVLYVLQVASQVTVTAHCGGVSTSIIYYAGADEPTPPPQIDTKYHGYSGHPLARPLVQESTFSFIRSLGVMLSDSISYIGQNHSLIIGLMFDKATLASLVQILYNASFPFSLTYINMMPLSMRSAKSVITPTAIQGVRVP